MFGNEVVNATLADWRGYCWCFVEVLTKRFNFLLLHLLHLLLLTSSGARDCRLYCVDVPDLCRGESLNKAAPDVYILCVFHLRQDPYQGEDLLPYPPVVP